MKRHVEGKSFTFFHHVVLVGMILCFLIAVSSAKESHNEEFNLEDLFGGGQDGVCGMTCPVGQKLVQRNGYKATSNGCGPSGEFNNISDKIGFTHCCDTHDTCYTDCSKTKDECDSEFSDCLNGHCSVKKTQKSEKKEVEECSNTATMFSFGVSLFGCDAYTKSIQEACECKPHDEL